MNTNDTCVSIIECTEPDELHQHYDRQFEAQPCYIGLDLRQETLRANYDVEIDGGVPESVYHGFERRYSIPRLTGDAANRVLTELAPLAGRILADWEQEWDGNNLVAALGEDAKAAEEEIEDILGLPSEDFGGPDKQGFRDEDLVGSWDLDSATNGDEVDEYGITADTTDTTLREIEGQIIRELIEVAPIGALVVPELYDYLKGLRDDLAEEDPLTDAEVRTAREWLGLTGDHMAQRLGVNPRTLRSWEQGRDSVPGWLRPAIVEMKADTDRAVEIVSAGLVEEDDPVLFTYRSDEEFKEALKTGMLERIPHVSDWSASWHRHVCARAAGQVGARLVYAELDDGEE